MSEEPTKKRKSKKSASPTVLPELTEEQRERRAEFALKQFLKERPEVRNIGNPNLDPEFQSVMRRAEFLLYPERFTGLRRFAHDLFDEGQIYSEQQIADIFRNAGWDGLKSKIPVTALMQGLRDTFEYEFNYETDLGASPAIRAHDTVNFEILPQVKLVLRARDFSVDHPGASEVFDKIRALMLELAFHGLSGTSNEHFELAAVKRRFLKWCFPNRRPDARAERSYRAYEIFKYAVAREWEWEKLLGQNNAATREAARKISDNLFRYDVFASSFSFPEDFLTPDEWKELDKLATRSADVSAQELSGVRGGEVPSAGENLPGSRQYPDPGTLHQGPVPEQNSADVDQRPINNNDEPTVSSVTDA